MWSALAGLAGSALSAGSSLLSTQIAGENAYQQMKHQLNLSLLGASKMPSYQVKGLRDAGLNPVLAANLGANFPSVSSQSIPAPDFSAVASSALGAMSVIKELKLLDAQIDKTEQESKESRSRQLLNTVERGLTENELEVSNVTSHNARMKAQIENRLLGAEPLVDVTSKFSDSLGSNYHSALQAHMQKSLDRANYLDSKGHAIFEDVRDSVGTASSAFSAFRLGRSRPYSRSRP